MVSLLNRFQTFRQCARRLSARLVVTSLASSMCVGYAHAECTNDDLPSIDSVQSLEQVFDAVARRGTDQVIRADLTAQGVGNVCIWVYEVKLLSSSGKVTNVVYDASALRMIGFRAPQSATEEEPSNGLLRGIGQRFGFFGRRDPSSEGRADSNRGDDAASTASSGNANTDSGSASDDTDAANNDGGTGAGGVASDSGANNQSGSGSNTDGESGSSSSSGSSGSGSGSSTGSGGSGNSSGSSN